MKEILLTKNTDGIPCVPIQCSVSYITVRTVRDLNLVSFLSKYGFSIIRKKSFMAFVGAF